MLPSYSGQYPRFSIWKPEFNSPWEYQGPINGLDPSPTRTEARFDTEWVYQSSNAHENL